MLVVVTVIILITIIIISLLLLLLFLLVVVVLLPLPNALLLPLLPLLLVTASAHLQIRDQIVTARRLQFKMRCRAPQMHMRNHSSYA